jgi:hypothetical protein
MHKMQVNTRHKKFDRRHTVKPEDMEKASELINEIRSLEKQIKKMQETFQKKLQEKQEELAKKKAEFEAL